GPEPKRPSAGSISAGTVTTGALIAASSQVRRPAPNPVSCQRTKQAHHIRGSQGDHPMSPARTRVAGLAATGEEVHVSDLIDTTEMYLKTVFELIEDGVVPLRARIAERLGHSGPTVSQTVARLERDGLMHVSGDRHLELTDEGMARATRVMRKHRLAERLLLDVIGLDWPHVHEEACRWEHVMSDQVEQQLVSLMSQPEHDPYGNPIPAADGTVNSTREGSRAL